jgi:bis(5'-nucleosidyl)-tetraphosphatase
MAEMMRESAGGIIVGKGGKIVLVCQHGDSWSFPKGQINEGESLLNAARREIAEETGIKDLILLQELGSYERYSIGKDGIGEEKSWGSRKRTFFLFVTAQSDFAPTDVGEVTQARFVTIDEALALLTHPKDAEFLKSVRSKIEEVVK